MPSERYALSVVDENGVEILGFSRDRARAICLLELREKKINHYVAELMNKKVFQPYMQVFRAIGVRLQS